MAMVKCKGAPLQTVGDLPEVGVRAPDFFLVNKELSEVSLKQFRGKIVLLNIFISLDTETCAKSVMQFASLPHPNIEILNVSKDLPFAQSRFCKASQLPGAVTLSAFRSTFGIDYGIEIAEGALKGLLARAVLLIDPNGHVIYKEQVQEISDEPDYKAALQTAIAS